MYQFPSTSAMRLKSTGGSHYLERSYKTIHDGIINWRLSYTNPCGNQLLRNKMVLGRKKNPNYCTLNPFIPGGLLFRSTLAAFISPERLPGRRPKKQTPSNIVVSFQIRKKSDQLNVLVSFIGQSGANSDLYKQNFWTLAVRTSKLLETLWASVCLSCGILPQRKPFWTTVPHSLRLHFHGSGRSCICI